MTQNPWLKTRNRTGAEYDAPYAARLAAGVNIHGEADFVMDLLNQQPATILDAGCGTGRLAIELHQRGCTVVGADLDEVMLTQAKAKAPTLAWHLADLSQLQLDQQFDCIVMAGNVMIYLTPNTEQAVLTNMCAHLRPGGYLVTAFQLNASPWSPLTLPRYETLTKTLGLRHHQRWATWDKEPWSSHSNYILSVHTYHPTP